MNCKHLLFASFFQLLVFGTLFSQPEKDFFGCHHALDFKLPALTEAQKIALQQADIRSDSIDILNYNVTLDVTNFSGRAIKGICVVSFKSKKEGLLRLPLDLLKLTVDSVLWQGARLTYDYDDFLLNVHLPNSMAAGDSSAVTVFYSGRPTADPSGFGGFVFTTDYAYNLGIGLSSNPYNFGRSWLPCFDNFVERSTWDYNIITNGGRTSFCSGTFLEEIDLGNGSILRKFRMPLQLPTYLSGVAVGRYTELQSIHDGQFRQIPVSLIGLSSQLTNLERAFQKLGFAIDALENWFGPYRWGKVGYVMTSNGAMEHSENIAFPDFSITSGETPAQNRLMAHELAHHWWGNVTTLTGPDNMWIKEGNAEYGAHLFTELAFGKDYFKNVVKDNHYDVLDKAHIEDDNNYLPLSGIPYEYTYGFHTYRKGASMMHNLRGYMGDSLFAQGMRSILETYEFSAIDAFQFRDQLMLKTGLDLTSFFDDWIFAPGYAGYEVDSVNYEPSGREYEATVFIQQKLRKAPHLHTNVPLDITFFNESWQPFTTSLMASGEFTEAKVSVPFLPKFYALNDNNRLNLAQTQERALVKNTGSFRLNLTGFGQPKAVTVVDSAMISVIHHWVAPDAPNPNPHNLRLSSTHYWTVAGHIPEGFVATTVTTYTGGRETGFDFDLTNKTEDSLILVYRPDTRSPWTEFPYYRKLKLSSTDGNGFINIDRILVGQYAFANGVFPPSAVKEAEEKAIVSVFPNPATDRFIVEAILPNAEMAHFELSDLMGRQVLTEKTTVKDFSIAQDFDISLLPKGFYLLKITDAEKRPLATEKIILE